MSGIFSLDNDVFASFVFYGSLALGKTLLMSSLTGIYRNLFKSMISKEDAIMIAPNNPEKQKRLLQPHESVERVSFVCFAYYVPVCEIVKGGEASGKF